MRAASVAARPERLSVKEYVALCARHFKVYWKRYTAPVVVLVVMQLFIRVDVNYTSSLPDHVFVTIKGWKSGLDYGDYVAYRFPTENPVSPFRKGDHMVKIVLGKPGDEVRIDDERNITVIRQANIGTKLSAFLADTLAGKAKVLSKSGKKLEAVSPGVIPEGHFYVFAPHRDSLDSRYKMVGFVSENEFIGRTFPIF